MDEKTYIDLITRLKRERIYRPLIGIIEDLHRRLEGVEEQLKSKPRGRPKKEIDLDG